MEYQYLTFFNELLFPTLSNWIVQFTAHAYVVSHFGYTVYTFQLEIMDV